jgi:Zn-finger protein
MMQYSKNNKCQYYPCHNLKDMSCVFCYCPLYNDNTCEGNFIIFENGIKDCSYCTMPHTAAGYKYIVEKLQEDIDK